jgi:hypothetical protein
MVPKDLLELMNPTDLTDPKVAFKELQRGLKSYVSHHNAQVLAWHLLLPQSLKASKSLREPQQQSLLPSYDTLQCLQCQESLRIPLSAPRYSHDTLSLARAVSYLPSKAQECSCGNLKTFTDTQGLWRVYTDNPESFTVTTGHIDLMSTTKVLEVPSRLLDSEGLREPIEKPFMPQHRELLLNHVNLYKCSEQTIAILFPYDNTELYKYARTYNIVVILRDLVIFPTGHVFHVTAFPSFPFRQFYSPIVTPQVAQERNDLIKHLYTILLPEAIRRTSLKLKEYLREHLGLFELLVPSTSRGFKSTKEPKGPKEPKEHYEFTPFLLKFLLDSELHKYPEASLLLLPTFRGAPVPPQVHRQDFYSSKMTTKGAGKSLRHKRVNLAKALRAQRQQRQQVVLFALPRLKEPIGTIISYAHETYQLPPLPYSYPVATHTYPRTHPPTARSSFRFHKHLY